MTNTITIDETEYLGGVTTRFAEMDVTDYDDDSGGDGESFVPADVSMRRFQHVHADVVDGTGYVAQYDESADCIRLYESAGSAGEMAEVGSNSGNAAKVALVCMGR